MLVVMEQGATEPQIRAVVDRLVEMGFTVHRSTGVLHTVLGGVGPMDKFDTTVFEVMPGVQECHRIVSPYKLASRHFRPQGSVVKIKNVEIGGGKLVVMAGPCSVESEDQIEESARIVAASGAQDPSRRRLQAPHLALQLPGSRRRRPADHARRSRPPRPPHDQ